MLGDWEISSLTRSFVVFCIFTFIIRRIAKWVKNNYIPVAHLPGRKGLPIFGDVLLFLNNPDLHRTLMGEAKRFGGLFKLETIIYPPTIVLTAPEYIKTFFTNTDLLDRSSHYKGMDDITPNSFLTSQGARWRELRKFLLVAFFNVPATTWVTNFCINSKSFVEDFRKKSDGTFFPSADILHLRASESIVLNSFGEKVDDEDTKTLVRNANEVFSMAYHRISKARLCFNFIFNITPEGKKFWKQVDDIDSGIKKYLLKKLNDYLELKEKQEPLPNLYIYNVMEKFGGDVVINGSLQMMAEDMKALLEAGQDTTTGVMGFTLTMLGILPEVQQKVYEEDQEVQRRLSGREPEPEDLKQYEYLERVIKETLRLFPNVPIMGRKVNKDTFFGTHLIPKGAEVAAFLLPSLQDPSIFHDPMKFDPDRFLPQNAMKIPPFAYTPFSAGPRNCPGQRYATMSLKIYLSAIVREFQIFSIYTSVEEAVNNSYAEYTMADKNKWTLRLESRRICPKPK